MRYLFLLYGDEQAEQAAGPAELEKIIAAHGEFTHAMRAEGREVGGAGLEPSTAATLVRRDGPDSAGTITDGPYAESREQVGGLYLIECADLDDALAVANRIPYSPGLQVEIRPAPY